MKKFICSLLIGKAFSMLFWGYIGMSLIESYTDIKTIIIPESVTEIGVSAFAESRVENVIILAQIEESKASCFYDCEYLTQVVLPESLISIGGSAFANCRRLLDIKIPASVTSIGAEAFFECESLKHITLPENIKTIRGFTFCACDSLETIIIPKSVTKIEGEAFCGCYNLTTVYYRGTENEWKRIVKETTTDDGLEIAEIVYNYTGV